MYVRTRTMILIICVHTSKMIGGSKTSEKKCESNFMALFVGSKLIDVYNADTTNPKLNHCYQR